MISILPFQPEDCEEAIALWKTSPGVGLSQTDTPQSLAHFLERNPGLNWIAKDECKVVGTLLCGYDGRRAYLYHVAVHPEYRRRGIGTALVNRCLDALKNIGVEKAHLFVYADNTDGIAFWTSLGWYLRNELLIVSYNL